MTRRISRDGIGAAGEDPARLRSALPDDPARDQAIARRIRAAHCDRISESRAERMLESWYARNVVIARRITDALTRAPQVVVIIGRGHQSPGGVPEQVDALRPGTRQLVVALAEGESGPPPDTTGDVVWLTPSRPRPDPCLSLPQRMGGVARPQGDDMPSDHETLLELNRDYIRSVQASDVRRFDEILAKDFVCSNPDGSLVDRARFLEQTARPVSISNLEAHDVVIRILGDVAIIHARTAYTRLDGGAGAGRYTDVWARREGRWLAVSAHVTRC